MFGWKAFFHKEKIKQKIKLNDRAENSVYIGPRDEVNRILLPGTTTVRTSTHITIEGSIYPYNKIQTKMATSDKECFVEYENNGEHVTN